MAFARRVITKTLDLLNLQRHNDNYADIQDELIDQDDRIIGAQSDITTHKASTAAHPAEHVTYEGEIVGAENIKEGLDIIKTELDQAIISGDSGPEAAASRYNPFTGITHATLPDRLNEEWEQTEDKFTAVGAQLADTGVSTLGDLHMVFQYNYENDPERLARLKSMGINTIILPHSVAWQRDVTRVKAFITRNNEYGLYTILEADTAKLLGASYQDELDFLSQMDNLHGLIGYYTLDEPVWKNVPIADQVMTYARMKSITSKNIFISEVPLLAGRESRFQTYYTPNSYDMYIINTYYSHLAPEDIVSNVVKAVTNFHRYGFDTPENIIANFPFYSDASYPYPATEGTTRAHVEGWKAFFTGNYAIFAHDNAAFDTTIDTNPNYQKYVGIIASTLKSGDVSQLGQFMNGINVAKAAALENTTIIGRLLLLLTALNDAVKLVPEADTNLNSPILYGTDHAQNLIRWAINRGGTGQFSNFVATDASQSSTFAGGATFGGGNRLKKYLVGSATLNFGTVSAGSYKDLTIAIAGSVVGDSVNVNAFVQPNGMIDYWGFVSASGVVTIRVKNGTSADIIVGSTSWYADVFNR